MNPTLLELLVAGDFDAILERADDHPGLLSRLTGLTYHPDERVADRAVVAFGMAAARIAARRPETVRAHLRRLFWLVNDESGGIGWRAPEMIGETLARCPAAFDEFLSPLAYLLDMDPEDAPRFQPGVLRALIRIAEQRPQCVAFARPLAQNRLNAMDPPAQRLARRFLEMI